MRRLAGSQQRAGNLLRLTGSHVEHAGVGRERGAQPLCLLFLDAMTRREKDDAAGYATLRQRSLQMRARRERGGHSGNDFYFDARFAQRIDLFLCTAEQHGIAALEAHHEQILARGGDEHFVDEALRD